MHTHKAVWRYLHVTGVGIVLAALALAAQVAGAREPNASDGDQKRPGVKHLLATSRTIVGEPVVYPLGTAKLTAFVVTLEPGQSTGWHSHAIPTFGYVLEGELTVDYGPHGKRVFKKGDALAEAIHAPHNGANTGHGVMRVLAVFMGAEGLPVSKKARKP